jgi:signal transduction histidine kinase
VNRSLNLREVFQYAIDTTGDALGLEVGAAFRLDEETVQGQDPLLTLLAHRGLSAEFLPFVEHLPLRGSMIEKTLPAGGPLAWTPSEYRLEPVRQALVQEGLAFGISVPFVAQGRLLGAMVLGSRKERFMNPEELSLLASIGQEVSMAVNNARLYDRAQQMAALEERNRLAQELHDSVTQSLYSLTLYAEAAARMLEAGKSKKAADQLRELGDTAREALNNILKHACARRVSVVLTLSPDEAALEVNDDGKGFDPDTGRASGGFGLAGMAERARRVGGKLTVQSCPGSGTKVSFRAPL